MSKFIPKLRFKEFSGEWDKKQINKILTIGSGRDYKHLSEGDIPVYGTGGYMLSVDKYLYNGESVCIGRKGTIDKPMFLTDKFWTVDTLFYTHSFKGNIPKFIYALFLKINWYKYNEASGVPSLSKINIGKINIFIPKPKEQQKIANCLSSLDSLIEVRNKKVEALKEHKKGLLQQFFPSEGKNIPKLRFENFNGEWEERKISEYFNSYSGGTPSTTKKSYYGGKIPFIRSAEINKIKTELFLTNDGLENSSAKLVNQGDVLYALYGANSGDVAVSKINGAINQAILCLNSNKASNSFLYYYLTYIKANIVKKYIQGGQGNLSGDIIKSLQLNFPKNILEQEKIANFLTSIDSLLEVQNKKIEALKEHKKGLMQQMFVSEKI